MHDLDGWWWVMNSISLQPPPFESCSSANATKFREFLYRRPAETTCWCIPVEQKINEQGTVYRANVNKHYCVQRRSTCAGFTFTGRASHDKKKAKRLSMELCNLQLPRSSENRSSSACPRTCGWPANGEVTSSTADRTEILLNETCRSL